ncbi:MAG TPA: M23 family metallopeptidase, partial [Gaiellaceae bacterium]|nr:M23 family metallopeptidase [Gaiellaceae bacterium]
MHRLPLLLLLCVPLLGAWTWPVRGPVLAPFAFDPAHPYAGGQHRGVDVGAADGAAVVAPAAGIVTFAGTVPSSGRSLTILTADGYDVTLTHLGSLGVGKGAAVAEGDAVGTVGPSGTPELDSPYVHLGVRTDANEQGYLDPLGFLPAPPRAAPAAVPPAPAPASTSPAVETTPAVTT